jgi:hypothetical protein
MALPTIIPASGTTVRPWLGKIPRPKMTPRVTTAEAANAASATRPRPGTSGARRRTTVGGDEHHGGDPQPRVQQRRVGCDDQRERRADGEELHDRAGRRAQDAARKRQPLLATVGGEARMFLAGSQDGGSDAR